MFQFHPTTGVLFGGLAYAIVFTAIMGEPPSPHSALAHIGIPSPVQPDKFHLPDWTSHLPDWTRPLMGGIVLLLALAADGVLFTTIKDTHFLHSSYQSNWNDFVEAFQYDVVNAFQYDVGGFVFSVVLFIFLAFIALFTLFYWLKKCNFFASLATSPALQAFPFRSILAHLLPFIYPDTAFHSLKHDLFETPKQHLR